MTANDCSRRPRHAHPFLRRCCWRARCRRRPVAQGRRRPHLDCARRAMDVTPHRLGCSITWRKAPLRHGGRRRKMAAAHRRRSRDRLVCGVEAKQRTHRSISAMCASSSTAASSWARRSLSAAPYASSFAAASATWPDLPLRLEASPWESWQPPLRCVKKSTAMIVTFSSLGLGLIVGYLGQRSRMCSIGGLRDFVLVRDTGLLKGAVALLVATWVAFGAVRLISGTDAGHGLIAAGTTPSNITRRRNSRRRRPSRLYRTLSGARCASARARGPGRIGAWSFPLAGFIAAVICELDRSRIGS